MATKKKGSTTKKHAAGNGIGRVKPTSKPKKKRAT